MGVCLLSRDYSTNYCIFSYDSWENDGKMMPNLNTSGKGILSTIKSCCQGSRAVGTDGTNMILTGENLWIPYQIGSSGGGGSSDSGGSSGSNDGFIEL